MIYPDKYLFNQFKIHASILTKPERYKYFMLSAGANLFPMPKVWKELMEFEIDNNLVYHWYTSAEGFPLLQDVIRLYETLVATQFDFDNLIFSHKVVMTIGATQAVTIVFDFIKKKYKKALILTIGYNYPLFDRLARYYNLNYKELINDSENSTLPEIDVVLNELEQNRPNLLILTIPNNPSGELYSEDYFVKILLQANKLGVLVLADKVGELVLSMSSQFLNIEKMALDTATINNLILINSFSKTDSVPGFRIGYIWAAEEIIKHASEYQANTIMCPQTAPILPVFFTLLSRTIYLVKKYEINIITLENIFNRFYKLFNVTTSIAPIDFIKKLNIRWLNGGYLNDYKRYIDEQIKNEIEIQRNYEYTINTLKPYICYKSNLKSGFNFLISIDRFFQKDENEICSNLLKKTGVAILTESAFCMYKKSSRNFKFRISLAAPFKDFQKAIDSIKIFIQEL